MRPYILYQEGIKMFVDALRDNENLVGRRIAGRALVNATRSDDTLRIKLIKELRGEI